MLLLDLEIPFLRVASSSLQSVYYESFLSFDSEIMSQCTMEHGCLYPNLFQCEYNPLVDIPFFNGNNDIIHFFQAFSRAQHLRNAVGYRGLVGSSHFDYLGKGGPPSLMNNIVSM